MKTIKTKHIVEELARELGVTQGQIFDVIESPYELQAEIMRKDFKPEEGKLPMLRIPNFAIFAINPKARKKLEERYGPIPDEE